MAVIVPEFLTVTLSAEAVRFLANIPTDPSRLRVILLEFETAKGPLPDVNSA